MKDGKWKRVPIKNTASASFFVLNNFLAEIGLVQWAQERGDQFLFPELMRLMRPSKSASSYMGRLFEKVNRPGFAGGSNFQIGWSHDEQNDEQVFP